MIYFKDEYKGAEVYHNDDGEFGQVTGWLMAVSYNAFGGKSGVARKVTEWHKKALLAKGYHIKLIKIFGKKLTDEKKHGATLYTFNGELYRFEMEVNPPKSI